MSGKISIIGVLVLIVMISGCASSGDTESTSNETSSNNNLKTYTSSQMSFDYPSDWSVSKEGENWVRFTTPNGETRVWVYTLENSPVEYESFTESLTVGNRTYKMLDQGESTVSYVLRENGKDLFIVGMSGDEEGAKIIFETAQF